jgi:5-methylcytosine-specific restriction protein A
MPQGIISSDKNPFIRDSWIEQIFSFTRDRQPSLERLLGLDYKKIKKQKPDNLNSYVAYVAIRWGFATITKDLLLPTYKWNHRLYFDAKGHPIPDFEISESQANRENQFNEKVFEIYELAKKLCNYNATRFLQKIRRDGGINAAKAWLNPKYKNQPPTDGFIKLMQNGRLDISLEALVLRNPWHIFFTSDELDNAKTRLQNYGYKDVDIKNENSTQTIPEEIPMSEEYSEGTKHLITVNAYERNQQARDKCIEHYGTKCVVCEFEFESFYGAEFKDYIHVHHLRPLSSIAENYILNPIEDLRPVCPNCHAAIHRKNPPFTITEIQKFIKRK